MTAHPQIQTPRLLLRRWQEADLGPFAKMNADPEVMRYFPKPYDKLRSQSMYDSIQQEFAEYGYSLYAAEERATCRFMGFIGFHRANFEADFCPCIEIGWRLDQAFWNKGYATEGAWACLKHGFGSLGFDKVYSFTAILNAPSQRVMQKIGMRFDNYFQHPALTDNHPLKSHICYSISKDEWQAHEDCF